jgi:hypothetical protein
LGKRKEIEAGKRHLASGQRRPEQEAPAPATAGDLTNTGALTDRLAALVLGRQVVLPADAAG